MRGSQASTKNGDGPGDGNLCAGEGHCAITTCSPTSPGRTCRASTFDPDLLLKLCCCVGSLCQMWTEICWHCLWHLGCLKTGELEAAGRRIAAWPFQKGHRWMAAGCPRPRCFLGSMKRCREVMRR